MSLRPFLDWDGWIWLEAIFTVVVWILIVRRLASRVDREHDRYVDKIGQPGDRWGRD